MNSNDEINQDNTKGLNQMDTNNQNQPEKNKKVNHCLPSFLTDDDYFKDNSNSIDEEESNEEKSIDNKKDNSTQDNSNNYLNYSQNQNSNFFYNNNNTNINNFNQFNPNPNFFLNDNNMMMNQNNNLNFNLNYLNNNFNSFNTGNSFNSLNNTISPNWNSFSGLSPINSFNFPNNNNQNNNYMLQLPFNTDFINNNDNNMKCLSFNQEQRQSNKKNISGVISKKYKSSKYEKIHVDDINNNNSNLSIKKLFDMNEQNLYNYIITQKGSRDVQNIIKKVNENDVEILITKIKNYFSDITIDKYGNYFSRKLIQICLPSQRIQLLESMNNRFVEIANNSYGTHPLQSLIEIINMPEEKKIVLKYILNNESILALDSKGTHVLQKFISCTKDEERYELNQNLINLIDKLIINPFGVCVLIQLVKHTKDKNITKKIANYITERDPLSFIQHPYANYAVQSLISNTDLSYCDTIIDTIVQNYLSLSMQKFSSNVVENCIKFGKENTVKKIFRNIIEQEKLESLLNNNYGNFVLEKLIARLNKEEKMIFIKKIEKLGKTKVISNTIKNLLYK
jgi:hypothetical protein